MSKEILDIDRKIKGLNWDVIVSVVKLVFLSILFITIILVICGVF